MNISKLARQAARLATDNSPLILTAIGVTGTITTAVLTGRASFQALQKLQHEDPIWDVHSPKDGFDKKEKLLCVWKLYIPPVVTGIGTITAIIFANRIGTRRAAAMAAAYTIAERGFEEYREKIVEKMGETKEKAARDEIAQERVNRAAAKDDRQIVVVADEGMVMCHDAFSNQFFYSNMEAIRKAVNDVNFQILHNDSATVSDFYHYIGSSELEETSVSGEMGWNSNKSLEVDVTTVLHPNKGLPCLSVNFTSVPVPQPWRFC